MAEDRRLIRCGETFARVVDEIGDQGHLNAGPVGEAENAEPPHLHQPAERRRGAGRQPPCARDQRNPVVGHELGATGTHVGCEHGVCGACTVRLDGAPARACLTLAVQADGRRVDTVEGLAPEGELNDLQKAFRRHHALQCGFCTAGILMTLDAWLESRPAPDEGEVRALLSGHLCRCTGYSGIVAAALDAAEARQHQDD